jgi:hypothetical protein
MTGDDRQGDRFVLYIGLLSRSPVNAREGIGSSKTLYLGSDRRLIFNKFLAPVLRFPLVE